MEYWGIECPNLQNRLSKALTIIPLFPYFIPLCNLYQAKSIPPTLTLPLSFDPEALDGEGGVEGGGDFLWLRPCRAVFICVPLGFIVFMSGRFVNRPYVFFPGGSAMTFRIRSGVMGSSNSRTPIAS